MPGKSWWSGFLARHPELKLKNPEPLEMARAIACSEARVKVWFQGFLEMLKMYEIYDASQVYNCDETGLPLQTKPNKVLTTKSAKNTYAISGNNKSQITCLFTIRADGYLMPPYVVYQGKRVRPAWVVNLQEGAKSCATDKGWMTRQAFMKWMNNMFLPSLEDPSKRGFIVLLVDGHVSHRDLALSKICLENKVVLYLLPPHTTHLLQPLDKGFYGPFKTRWRQCCQQYITQKKAPVDKYSFAKVLEKTIKLVDKPKLIQSAFECCGIWPANANRPSYDLMGPSKAFEASEPIANINSTLDVSDSSLSSQDQHVSVPMAYVNDLPALCPANYPLSPVTQSDMDLTPIEVNVSPTLSLYVGAHSLSPQDTHVSALPSLTSPDRPTVISKYQIDRIGDILTPAAPVQTTHLENNQLTVLPSTSFTEVVTPMCFDIVESPRLSNHGTYLSSYSGFFTNMLNDCELVEPGYELGGDVPPLNSEIGYSLPSSQSDMVPPSLPLRTVTPTLTNTSNNEEDHRSQEESPVTNFFGQLTPMESQAKKSLEAMENSIHPNDLCLYKKLHECGETRSDGIFTAWKILYEQVMEERNFRKSSIREYCMIKGSSRAARKELFVPSTREKKTKPPKKNTFFNLSSGEAIKALEEESEIRRQKEAKKQENVDKRLYRKKLASEKKNNLRRPTRLAKRKKGEKNNINQDICSKCDIGYVGDEDEPVWVKCDTCDRWYHSSCADFSDCDDLEMVSFSCEFCK